MEKKVGEIIHVEYDTITKEMKIIIRIEDAEYKQKILRDFRESEKLLIKNQEVMTIIEN